LEIGVPGLEILNFKHIFVHSAVKLGKSMGFSKNTIFQEKFAGKKHKISMPNIYIYVRKSGGRCYRIHELSNLP
jgi:hypothetical protein